MMMNAQILTADDLARTAPAIFAQHASPTRKETYGFVSTSEVLATLALDGWMPTYVGLKKSRTEEKRQYGSHTLRLRHVSDMMRTSEGVPEIVLRNGHDGSSAVKLDLGFFRFVCANGLVCGTSLGGFRLFHSQYAADKVREGLASVVRELPKIGQTIEAMRAVTLLPEEQMLFAESAARLRWGTEELVPVPAQALIAPTRYADQGQDLWTTFNVVQEHLTKGGDRGRTQTNRRMRTRAVTGVDVAHRLNRELWALAEGMAAIKNGSPAV